MKVRYYGHVGQSTGYGKAANDLCMALLRVGVELEIRPLALPSDVRISDAYLPLANHIHREGTLDPNPDVVIVHTLPLDCRKVFDVIHTTAPKVAYTTWETRQAPGEVIESLADFDQVWTPSDASADALGDGVVTMPHCFDEETLPMRRSPGAREKLFTFYYIGAWTARKDPAALVRTFARTFTKADPVQLWLHSKGLTQAVLAQTLASTGIPEDELPKFIVSSSRTEEAMLEMHRSCDCFVTASHGEAWNLPAFDAWLAKRHVIVPGGQGSEEFLSGSSAERYPSRKGIAQVDVTERGSEAPGFHFQGVLAQGLSSRCTWDDPDLLELSYHMKQAAVHNVRDLTYFGDPRELFGYTAVGERALAHLTELTS